MLNIFKVGAEFVGWLLMIGCIAILLADGIYSILH